MDLPRDLGTDRLTWRRLSGFLRNLPPDSATWRAAVPPANPWGLREQLLAAAVDTLRVANWQRAGDKKVPFPKPIPRPGVKAPGPTRTELSPAEIQSRLRRLHQRDQQRRAARR